MVGETENKKAPLRSQSVLFLCAFFAGFLMQSKRNFD